jgi:uncharacterized surface protein with fasciclin (FAS1) repeats
MGGVRFMSFGHQRAAATALAVAGLLALSTAGAGADPAADPIGPGCAAYAPPVQTGAASLAGMAPLPLTVAASHHPKLTALSAAFSGKLNPAVNLVDTLDGGQFTVFAPVDSAFSRVPPETIDSLRTDAARLTNLLTYHVVPGRLSPNNIDGTRKTLQGGDLSVTGPPNRIRVNDALVLCGGIRSANATIYLIDTVLSPPSEW